MLKIFCATPISHIKGLSKEIGKYGKLTCLPSIDKKKLKEILGKKKHNCLLVNPNKQGFILDKSVLSNSDVRLINTCSTGTNHIDMEFCKIKGIKVFSLADDKNFIKQLTSTSELAFGLMISLLRNILTSHKDVMRMNWNYDHFIGRQIKDLKVGVIGYGRLGKIFCKQLNGFGADIIVIDPYIKNCKFKQLSLQKAALVVDVFVIHIHLNSKTRNLINKKIISKMKRGSFIVNTSRGEIVNETDIVHYLSNGQLSGYACDVVSNELENIKNSIIIKNANKYNIIVTPHIGGMTSEGQKKAYFHAVSKFKNVIF